MKRNIILLVFFLFVVNNYAQEVKQLVILHMNDTHSRIEPLPKNAAMNPDEGGMARIAACIQSVRKENPLTLVFHAGDFVQGTPYFNMFKGKVEVDLLNKMNIDAACLGNHEFDYGYPVLEKLIKQAKFPVVSTNYDFSGTPLKGKTKGFLILHKGGLKIGIIGLGIDPEGLIAKSNYAGMKFLPPIETANKVALFLKEKEKCDLIVCLSHLGYSSNPDVNDIKLAQKSRHIDIIIGGHSHTFLREPDRKQNLDGKEVIINQMGKNGIYIGRLDVTLKEKEGK